MREARKIPLKYGLFATLGAAASVLIAHALLEKPMAITPIFLNVFEFAMIYLGLKALERETGERPTFKELLKTGVGIAFVYAVTISLFFVGAMTVVGTKWLESEPGAGQAPMSRVMAGAFIGLFIGAIVFGLFYSTVISFFLAKRRSDEI
jgi:uncharacterized membrane protein